MFYGGQTFDAYERVLEILKKAKKEIIIVDRYADDTILEIIKRFKVNVIIITKENNKLKKQDIKVYNSQYNNLKVVYDDTFHDRYFIIDRKDVYYSGSSINSIGYRTTSILFMNDKDAFQELKNKIINMCNNV